MENDNDYLSILQPTCANGIACLKEYVDITCTSFPPLLDDTTVALAIASLGTFEFAWVAVPLLPRVDSWNNPVLVVEAPLADVDEEEDLEAFAPTAAFVGASSTSISEE